MIFQIGSQYRIDYRTPGKGRKWRHIAVRETHYDPNNYMNSYIVAWDFDKGAYRTFRIENIFSVSREKTLYPAPF